MAFMLLCDKENLRRTNRKMRSKTVETSVAASTVKPDKEGFVKGRDGEGNPIKGKIRGESLVARKMREKKEREEKEAHEKRLNAAKGRKRRR